MTEILPRLEGLKRISNISSTKTNCHPVSRSHILVVVLVELWCKYLCLSFCVSDSMNSKECIIYRCNFLVLRQF